MGRDPGDDFAVMSVDLKGDANQFAIPARDLEAIGRPARVGDSRKDATLMSPDVPP